jgi:hypothetical protein
LTYPDGSLQKFFDDHCWWEKSTDKIPSPGRLIWAFVPHVDLIPQSFIPTGRAEDEASNHGKASYELAALRITSHHQRTSLPAAILPCYPGEGYTVHRSKKRPALILSTGGVDVPRQLRSSMKPSWHTSPTMTVAPYYGVLKKGISQWYEPFVKRIKKCEYPQYIWDTLPISSDTESSILRLDHMQPVGFHHDSYELTDYILKPTVVSLLNEWLDWLLTGTVDEDSILNMIRDDLLCSETQCSR